MYVHGGLKRPTKIVAWLFAVVGTERRLSAKASELVRVNTVMGFSNDPK